MFERYLQKWPFNLFPVFIKKTEPSFEFKSTITVFNPSELIVPKFPINFQFQGARNIAESTALWLIHQ